MLPVTQQALGLLSSNTRRIMWNKLAPKLGFMLQFVYVLPFLSIQSQYWSAGLQPWFLLFLYVINSKYVLWNI